MKNRYRGDKKIDIAATKKSISRRRKNQYRGDEKIDIAATKNRYRGDKKPLSRRRKIAIAARQSRRPLEKLRRPRNNQQSRRWPEEKRQIRIEHGAPLKREASSNMEHHLRERSVVKHGAPLKREASGRFNDLGLQLLLPAEESDSWHQ